MTHATYAHNISQHNFDPAQFAQVTGRHIAFYLYPNFSMLAYASAIEGLRLANRIAGRTLYKWTTISTNGESVIASNEVLIQPDSSAAETRITPGRDAPFDYAFICGGAGTQHVHDSIAESWLRVQALQKSVIGSLCTGAHVLARAGLLDGHKCVIHWESLPAFRESFPEIEVSTDLYEIDGERMSCGGGTAALDLMLHLIRNEHGNELAWAVSELALVDQIRQPDDQQRLSLQDRLGLQNPKIIKVIGMMEAHIAEPIPLEKLAYAVDLSRRQLERLFARHVGRTPARYYLEIRLQRARNLLFQSELSILDIALATGFVSASHFSKTYKQMYGRAPRAERDPEAIG
jgi:transcriptional regulator GlxA family with amidase domain